MDCCRCRSSELAPRDYRAMTVQACATCDGMLVEMRHLVPMLEEVSRLVAAEVGVDSPIPVQDPDRTPTFACPGCRLPMERFGYLGTKVCYLDRCGACRVVWMDGAELVAAAQLHARTQRRSEERAAFRKQQADSLARLVHAVLVARARSDWIA